MDSCITVPPDISSTAASNMALLLGSELSLTCDYEAVPLPTMVQWLINDTLFLNPEENSRVTVDTNETRSILILTELQRNEGGNYSCNVTNSQGSTIQKLTTVYILGMLHVLFVSILTQCQEIVLRAYSK